MENASVKEAELSQKDRIDLLATTETGIHRNIILLTRRLDATFCSMARYSAS